MTTIPPNFPPPSRSGTANRFLVALMANTSLGGLVTDVVPAAKSGCGRDQKSEAIIATRIDYHYDWIISKTGGATR